MAVPSSGAISLAGIRAELATNTYNASATTTASLEDCSDGTVATINTGNASSDRPNGSAPHAMSEFYAYDHDVSSFTDSISFDFDGTNDRLEGSGSLAQAFIGGATTAGAGSISIWVKLDSIQDCNGPRFLNWSSSFQLGVLQHGNIPPGGLWYGHNNGINNVGMDITYNVLDWNHIIYTYDSDSIRLYINNSLQGSVENTLISNSPGISTQLRLGHSQSNSGSINGEMDDLGIWNRVLDINEIGSLYGGSCQVYDTITILDTIPYSVTDTLFIDVQLTSTNPIQFQNTIKVYPNPTNDYLQIDCGDISTMNGYSIKIINSLSQTVFDEPVSQSTFNIDMNGWSGNGLYFFHLIDGSGNITDIRKIVLQ